MGDDAADAALEAARAEARGCQACDLYREATQTVFSDGPAGAVVVFVGEAPGDREDLKGRPFVGPAGQLFERALGEAGIERGGVYLTNAVKHFKFVLTGRRRIHQKPDSSEIKACKPWLLRELDAINPRLIVAMGATAAQSLLGKTVTIGRERGRFRPFPPEAQLYITVHPSFLLRLPNEDLKAVEYARFVDDLKAVKEFAEHGVLEDRAATGPAQASLL
jgi:DNA polymerase